MILGLTFSFIHINYHSIARAQPLGGPDPPTFAGTPPIFWKKNFFGGSVCSIYHVCSLILEYYYNSVNSRHKCNTPYKMPYLFSGFIMFSQRLRQYNVTKSTHFSVRSLKMFSRSIQPQDSFWLPYSKIYRHCYRQKGS